VNGLLLVDKPAGPTSHDVVARLRRSSRERTIGHTGTLDPRATGLLPLLFGGATRLASLLLGGDKTYEAVIRLGLATSTDDDDGQPIGEPAAVVPDDAAIRDALDVFRGTFEQVPPRHSAKRVGGERAYDLARRDVPVDLKPVTVTVHELEWRGRVGDAVSVRVKASSGFYVRALARDLGRRLGCGGHLQRLRRTASGPFTVDHAVPLDEAEALGSHEAGRLLSAADALPHLPAVQVGQRGQARVSHGNPIGPEHLAEACVPEVFRAVSVRVLDETGRLLAVASPRGGALHPVVVLG
jgi:tRNA pseudouridine55 synthase